MLPASRLVLLRGKVLHPYRQVFGALGVGLELQILSRNQDNRQSCDRHRHSAGLRDYEDSIGVDLHAQLTHFYSLLH